MESKIYCRYSTTEILEINSELIIFYLHEASHVYFRLCLQEFAECLNDLSPDQAAEHQRAIEQANENARQLAEIRNNLEEQRKENDDRMKREMEGNIS